MITGEETTGWLSTELAALREKIAALEDMKAGHQRTAEALQKNEAYFKAVTQNASDLIIITDKTGTITYVNASIERFLGYTPDELIGRSAFDYIIPEDITRAMNDYGKAVLEKNTIMTNSFRIRHRDGSERVLEGVGSNLLDHPVVAGFVMTVRDVTERWRIEEELRDDHRRLEDLVEERTSELAKTNARLRVELSERRRVEEALRASEERFRALIQQSSDIISILDDQGLFVYNSPATETILGYPPDFLTGKRPFEYIHPEDRQHIHGVFANVIQRTNQGKLTEFRFKKADGSWIYLESLGNNLIDNPAVKGIVITSRDVTKRKNAEEEHRLLERRLHRAQKMESLGTLAGGVAHDLNNVLGGLVGYSDLLLMEIPAGHPSRGRVSRILQSGQKAAAIIADLLTLARRGVPTAEVVNMNRVIQDCLKTLEFEKLKTGHPQVAFRTELEADLPNIKGSPVHLEKTVMNLLSNAAEAIPGAGEVVIRTGNRYLDKAIGSYDDVKEGDYVVLTVSDNGRGIATADIEKIFEPFYTKKVMGRSGTGLGLAVVWGTVKDHNGYLDVLSRDGDGSTFTIFFPATREDLTTEDEPLLSLDRYLGEGESILVVDDVLEQRELAASMLTSLGYRVDTVPSGEDAVAYLKSQAADLLFLDMIMEPGIDGLETYRRVLQVNPGQKAVIVSGYSETERVKKALHLGAGSYIRKPYTIAKVGPAIRDTLDPSK